MLRRRSQTGLEIIAETVARQAQPVDGGHHRVRIEPGVSIAGVGIVDAKLQIPGDAGREIGLAAVGEPKVLAALVLVSVMLHDEAARAPHHVQPHQITPVVRVFALLESGQRPHRTLMATDEFVLAAEPGDQFLRPDADVGVLAQEQAQLGRKVEISLVVGRGGQQDAQTVVALDVVADDFPALAFAVAQIVGFVDQQDAEATGLFRQFLKGSGNRQHLGAQPVAMDVILPHRDQIPGAQDEGFKIEIVLEHLGQGRGHQRLAQTHHIADQHAAALVQVLGGDLDRRDLEIEQDVAEHRRNAEFGETSPRFLGQVIGHFQIDVIGRHEFFARPALVDEVGQFPGDVEAPAVAPARLEPVGQLDRGVRIEHIDIQLALLGESGQGQIAAAEIAHNRIDRVPPKQQIQLGVQRVAQVHLDDQLARPELAGELPQGRLIGVGRHAEGQLIAEFLGDMALFADGGLIVESGVVFPGQQRPTQLVRGADVHTHQQAATLAHATRPAIDVTRQMPPAAQVEVADAEIPPLRDLKSLLQRRQQRLLDVIEDPRHGVPEFPS